MPQDDATAAEEETHETEAAMDSPIQRYLKTVRKNTYPKRDKATVMLEEIFFHRKKHAVFSLFGDSTTGFNVDSPCARYVFVWLPIFLPSAPGFFKCTRDERLIKHGTVFLYIYTNI